MYAVIFEVEPKEGREADYLDLAAALKSDLEKIDGFISVERFRSLGKEGKLLSLSFWRDADSVKRWREHARHRLAQARGHNEVFADYRISVAEIERQYGKFARREAPPMFFDNETREMVRKAVAGEQWQLLYTMVPAMDGGQTYEMKCKICGEFGNILASEFHHAPGCPVDIEEKELIRLRKNKWSPAALLRGIVSALRKTPMR